MYKTEYNTEVERMLTNEHTYKMIKKDPTNRFLEQCNQMLTDLAEAGYITEIQLRRYKQQHATPP